MIRRARLCALALAFLAACQAETVEEFVDEPATRPAAPAAEQVERGEQSRPSPKMEVGLAKTEPPQAVACGAAEEVIFSCKVENGKSLSVCVTGGGKGEYRYGGDMPELVLQDGKWARETYSGGGESQIQFTNGTTSYTVFSRMVRTHFEPDEPYYPAISDGVIVERGEEVLTMLLCQGGQADMPIQYDAAERVFGEKEDLFTGATMKADPHD